MATKHLIDLGHRTIAIVTGEPLKYSNVFNRRYLGYKKALAEANLSEVLFENERTAFIDGNIAGEKILRSEQKITAIFTVADILAIGIMKTLLKNKKNPRRYFHHRF